MRRMNLQDMQRFGLRTAVTPIMAMCLASATASGFSPDYPMTNQQPTDSAIVDAVDSDLFFQSRVDASKIDVSAEKGVITLKGTAPTLAAKRRVIDTARSTRGVRSVIDRVNVQKTDRSDRNITSDIQAALSENPATKAYKVSANASSGHVTLTGAVDSMTERWLAEDVAASIKGVRSIENEININESSARLDSEIRNDIEERLKRDVRVDEWYIAVDVKDGDVTLTGAVGSAAERLNAARLAHVAGVNMVDISNLYVTFAYNDDMLKSVKRAPNFTSSDISQSVHDAIMNDPRVGLFDVDVAVNDRAVTLSGTVPTLGAMRAAVDDARLTSGVTDVRNHINVRPSGDVSDANLLADVNAALYRDSLLADHKIDVVVNDGVVTLNGDVMSDYEKRQASYVVEQIDGVTQVVNKLDYENTWEWSPDDAIKSQIEDQLFWSPFVDSDAIKVTVDNGIATLRGTVDDFDELQAARENAWEGGARDVILKLDYTSGS